ncbi:MAG: dihydrodipicolinate synthase [Peptococcaceae bacterium BICA1-7]|nr:MAG: dihydrodipicolinate synthase [Peptococcaceae bacterium BICA1-7]HBV96759.1 4-hydroxy-tetrahydrodipicolinate synthase [Desulfotomaculum sp.]
MHQWGRLITAMITPFNDDGSVNYARAGTLAVEILNNGSDALVVAGTTGESATLYAEEKIRLIKTVKECVGNQGAVIAGTGSNFTAESVKLSAEAEKAGADGLLLVAPYYNRPTQEGLYEHFKAIAAGSGLPVMLYNVPGRTSCSIDPDTVARLSEIPNIVAIKDAGGSVGQTVKLLAAVPADFEVYSGDDALTLPMMAVGASGVVSVAGHLAGGALKKMIRQFLEGDNKAAASLNIRLSGLFETLFVTSNPIPVKEMLNQLGAGLGGHRLPLKETDVRTKEIIGACLLRYRELGLLDSFKSL